MRHPEISHESSKPDFCLQKAPFTVFSALHWLQSIGPVLQDRIRLGERCNSSRREYPRVWHARGLASRNSAPVSSVMKGASLEPRKTLRKRSSLSLKDVLFV